MKAMVIEISTGRNTAILDTKAGTITGQTYYLKDWLKKYIDMKWDKANKRWLVDGEQAIEALKANRSEFANYATLLECESDTTETIEQPNEAAPVEITKTYDADLPEKAADIADANFAAEAAKALEAQPEMKDAIQTRASEIHAAIRDVILPEFARAYADPSFHERFAANDIAEQRINAKLVQMADWKRAKLVEGVLRMFRDELNKLPDRC